MAKFKKKKQKKNLIMLIVMLVFAVVGITCLVIGFGSDMLVWLRTFGIVILALISPILVYLIYTFVNSKVKEM